MNPFFLISFLKDLLSESDKEPDTILYGFGVLHDMTATNMMNIAPLPCAGALHYYIYKKSCKNRLRSVERHKERPEQRSLNLRL